MVCNEFLFIDQERGNLFNDIDFSLGMLRYMIIFYSIKSLSILSFKVEITRNEVVCIIDLRATIDAYKM